MGKIIGIDLGTTNSLAAFKLAEVEVVTADENTPPERKLTRSIVASEQDKLWVGEKAYNQLLTVPENVIVSIKRLMGRGFGDSVVQEQLSRFGYKISKPTSGTENAIAVWLEGKEYQPEDISAEIIKQVVENASAYQNAEGETSGVTSAVVTIPAYFDDKQRFATLTAAKKAGLTLLELLPEPTAAAISYGFKPDLEDVKTILVYDFGGGTFDSCLITAAGNQFIESSKAGDLWLGGDDIDNLIVEFVKNQVAQEEELDDIDALIEKMPLYQRVRFKGDLKIAAEQAKVNLSSAETTHIIPSTPLLDESGSTIYIDVELTRAKFEEMISPFVERSLAICQNAIANSDYPADMVDVILLVGGSSQIPLVQRKVKEVFGESKVVVHPRPMYAVAEGAAIVAAGLTEKVGTLSRDYCIKLVDGSRYDLISRGEILPVKTSHTFKTVADGQRLIHLQFFSPDYVRENLDDSLTQDEIGEMWLGVEQHYPPGTEILVTLEIDERIGYLQATAALKNEPEVLVSCSFSRGGVDEKVYSEIEAIIESIQKLQAPEFWVEEKLKKAVEVVKLTNQIIDNKTGEENPELVSRARQSLSEFKVESLPEYNWARSLVNNCEFIIKVCDFLMSSEEQERLENLIKQLEEAVANVDVEAMERLSSEIHKELEELPDEVYVIYISMVAINRTYILAPTSAQAMNDKLNRMIIAMQRDRGAEAERLWEELQPDVDKWLKEEMPIGSVVTGIAK